MSQESCLISDSSLFVLYLCVGQQGEKICGAEDRDMEESDVHLHHCFIFQRTEHKKGKR